LGSNFHSFSSLSFNPDAESAGRLIAAGGFASGFAGTWLVVAEVLAGAGEKLATKLGDSSFAKGF
jgi:hypothetical protein